MVGVSRDLFWRILMFDADAWRRDARLILKASLDRSSDDILATVAIIKNNKRVEAIMESLPYLMAEAIKKGGNTVDVTHLRRHDDYEWKNIEPDPNKLPKHTMGELCGAGKLVFERCKELGFDVKLWAFDWTDYGLVIPTPKEL